MTLRIGIAGIRGRMGREIAAHAANDQRMMLIGGLSRRARTAEPGPDGVRLFADAADLLPEIDVLIDFSAPEGTVDHAAACASAGVPIVCGTTGLDADPDGSAARGGGASRGLPRGEHESRGECRPRRLARPRARPRRATTSRSSKRTTGTKWMRRPGPPWRWRERWLRPVEGISRAACGMGARGRAGGMQTRSAFTPSGREAIPVSTP